MKDAGCIMMWGVYSDILNWVVKIALSLNSVVAVLCDIQSFKPLLCNLVILVVAMDELWKDISFCAFLGLISIVR